MSFKEAIQNTVDLVVCYRPGLQALRADSSKIKASQTNLLEGSVNIDDCVKEKYPNDSRWDYVLGYKERVYYVEVHPASTSEVRSVLAKLDWLEKWIRGTALNNLVHKSTYHWIASGSIRITRNSKYSRLLAQSKISQPSRTLDLDD